MHGLKVLYKVKCKSDLDKSAKIKKLKLNYEMELMKFRTEDNCDLVSYLEKKINSKDLQIMEQSFELDTWRSADNTLNSNAIAASANGPGHDTSFNSLSNSVRKYSSGTTGTKKTAPIDVIFSSDPDVVISANRTDADPHKNCVKKNRDLQDKIYALEKQLLTFRNQVTAVGFLRIFFTFPISSLAAIRRRMRMTSRTVKAVRWSSVSRPSSTITQCVWPRLMPMRS